MIDSVVHHLGWTSPFGAVPSRKQSFETIEIMKERNLSAWPNKNPLSQSRSRFLRLISSVIFLQGQWVFGFWQSWTALQQWVPLSCPKIATLRRSLSWPVHSDSYWLTWLLELIHWSPQPQHIYSTQGRHAVFSFNTLHVV